MNKGSKTSNQNHSFNGKKLEIVTLFTSSQCLQKSI